MANRVRAFRKIMDQLFDFRGTGWVGHDPDMPRGGYDE